MINILNPDGTVNQEGGDYEGCTIPEARKRVVADLEEAELLGEVEDRDIELPLSDRSKTAIEPYLADQWFVAMDQLAQSAMDAVEDDRVQIFPERYRKGYLDWLSEKRDWPVSRHKSTATQRPPCARSLLFACHHSTESNSPWRTRCEARPLCSIIQSHFLCKSGVQIVTMI